MNGLPKRACSFHNMNLDISIVVGKDSCSARHLAPFITKSHPSLLFVDANDTTKSLGSKKPKINSNSSRFVSKKDILHSYSVDSDVSSVFYRESFQFNNAPHRIYYVKGRRLFVIERGKPSFRCLPSLCFF